MCVLQNIQTFNLSENPTTMSDFQTVIENLKKLDVSILLLSGLY